jgi:hypothetical protein
MHPPAKIFGIGLSKTGTATLTEALNILGIRSIHFPQDEHTARELKGGVYRLTILRDYDAVTDTPVAPFYAQFDRAWPGSRFILTVRDKDSWLRSVETHWRRLAAVRATMKARVREYVDFINASTYGCLAFNPERFSHAYDLHVRNVKEYFVNRPDDLLVLDICGGEAWAELCGFLGVQPPPGTPFPHANRTTAVRKA